jgi:hypothetical protein
VSDSHEGLAVTVADVDLSAKAESVPELGDWARFGVLDREH